MMKHLTTTLDGKTALKTTNEKTNDEFMSHLMTGYNKHGALVQMVIMTTTSHTTKKSLKSTTSPVKTGVSPS